MRIFSISILATVALTCLGLLMVFNTTSAEIIDKGVITYIPLLRQFLHILFGSVLGWICYVYGYDFFLSRGGAVYVTLLLLLTCVFVPKIGVYLNGSHRWLNIFGVSLQPSEITKLGFPVFYLYLLKKVNQKVSFKTFCLWQIPLLLPICLILLEPDNGTAFILIVTLILLYFITKVRLIYWLIPTAVASVSLLSVALSMPHVTARITSYLNPESDILGKGHQAYQAKIAAGCGLFFGRGLGESMQKYHYLPEARSDYIAAIYAEEFGFLGIVLLVSLYTLIAAMGFAVAFKTKDIYAHYLVVTYTFIISFGAFLNLGIVSGMLPSKGTNLPFFSAGGSSFISNLLMIAIILSVYRKSTQEEKLLGGRF
ncbi:MAG: putative peptidoglycan glycosyltransferase FtsW [Chlamydiia bacterium]|nr:putative peptidoglycan glycosyltransferase FtsW [Chlamydiia bacterium]